MIIYVFDCERADLHPGHAEEWDEGERNEIEQSRLGCLENLRKQSSLENLRKQRYGLENEN